MCGIIALLGKEKIDSSTLDRMIESLAQRGPDEKGSLAFPSCLLAHTRLSILDLGGGRQPMKDNVRNIAVTFNGEIYNYKELRSELEKKGHIFSTNSDTEVILKSYIEYGRDCPKHLDGMFAFVIWDEEKKELFMARDRFGKKPLYFTYTKNGTLMIASEIKTLFENKEVKGEVDLEAIDNYLTLLYIPPWKSVYKNISVIPPAGRGVFKDGKLQTDSYWVMREMPQAPTYEEAKAKIEELFQKAVEKRMVADVEVGSLLSGGVDSTLVTYFAQKYTDRPLKTFSVGYTGNGSELPFALEASKKIGTDHYTLDVAGDLTLELEKVIEYMDEPHGDTSNFPQHLVSSLAGSKVKVALSGDGADELFMGYGWYTKYWNTRKITRLKNIFLSNPFKEYLKNISIFSLKERKSLWKDREAVNLFRPRELSLSKDAIRKINRFDLSVYLPGQLLSKVDRTGMMHSLEVRSPFLDTELAEYVFNIPTEYKMDKKNGKIILKDILSKIMPPEFVHRRKQGFGAPVKNWLQEEKMKTYVKTILSPEAHIHAFLKQEKTEKLLREFYEGNEKLALKIWSLLCLELWFKKHAKNHK